MTVSIDASSFRFSCLSRSRGGEAFQFIRAKMEMGSVELDLRNIQYVSLSFLDEIVVHSVRGEEDHEIVFRTNDGAVEGMIARIAGTRNVGLLVALGNGEPHRVAAENFDQPGPIVLEPSE